MRPLFITWQVIYRYIITQFIERAGAAVWTEELSRYIFIWISYLALCVAIKKRSSIRVDMLYDKLPPRIQQISWIVVEVLFFALTATIAWFGWGQIERLMQYPQYTTALRIPFLVPYLVLPLGFGLMCFRLLQSMYKQVKVCGFVDTLIGLVAVFVIVSPVIFCDYIDPLPALFGYFVLLCAIGVPVAISLGLSTLVTIICADTLPIEYMAQVAFTSIDSFPIMAIPFFIAAGVFMGAGGLSHRLLSLADEIVGGLYGGIGLTAIVTCMFFGAISGSGPATVAAIATVGIERGHGDTGVGQPGFAQATVGQFQFGQNDFLGQRFCNRRQRDMRGDAGIPQAFQDVELAGRAVEVNDFGDEFDFILVARIDVAHGLFVEGGEADGICLACAGHGERLAEVFDGIGTTDGGGFAAL